MSRDRDSARIDEFLSRSRKLCGQTIVEREAWNTAATADAVRHFAYGISDDNPLWLDPGYAACGPYRRLVAPPSFLASVLYPGLHGAPMEVPLSSLISELSFEWYRPLIQGDFFRGQAKQLDVRESTHRQGRRLIYVLAEIAYTNQRGEAVAKALSTMARVHQRETEPLVERQIYRYSSAQLEAIKSVLRSENRTGARTLSHTELEVGYELPVMVRGPLTVGDLIAWQAAIGPPYRAASLALRDCDAAPHMTAINPITGWPYRYSQQHEDSIVSKQRGMPAPFDNTVMRFAWLSTMLTNWMGDGGSLRSLEMSAVEPVLYGDTNWYRGEITRCASTDTHCLVEVKLTGNNQLDQTTTVGRAEIAIRLPSRAGKQAPAANRVVREDAPHGDTFLAQFAQRVRQYADKQAVVCGVESLTYRELDRRANRLAHHLRDRGIGPGSRIGMSLGRSLDTVVGILGVVKTGAAYVPFDEEFPVRALATMMVEARVDLCLSDGDRMARLPVGEGSVVRLEQVLGDETQDCTGDSEIPPGDTDIAYVMFTSGTTGVPKAVAVTFRSLNLYLAQMHEALDMRPVDVCMNTAPFSFSASTRQTFLPLYCGCTMILADEEERRNQHVLLSLLKQAGVTVWDTGPTSMRLCTDYLHGADPEVRGRLLANDLRLICTTGEALPWAIPDTWINEFKLGAKFLNLYSQTETSGTVCMFEIPRGDTSREGYVPIGLPIRDIPVYVLDAGMNPVPRGEQGELYVGGDRVAFCYVNDPRLSGEKFLNDPFAADLSARLYKTGDLVSEQPDGNLQVFGRSDTRVKINGYRLELTEVETAINACKSVRRSAVGIRVISGEKRLVAYVVPEQSAEMDTHRLREYLQDRLPTYMIPSAFASMDSLPTTKSGKLDRHFLTTLDVFEKSARDEKSTIPSNEIEEALLKIWKRVLELDTLGVEGNFYELGGHSLAATRLSFEIFEQCGHRVNVVDILRFPTVRALARHIETKGAGAGRFWAASHR